MPWRPCGSSWSRWSCPWSWPGSRCSPASRSRAWARRSGDVAQERAEQSAKALAGSADRLPNTALQAARSIAAASAAFRSPDRRQLQAQIAAAAQLTPDVLDTWVVYEPGTAPGRDADWRGRPGMSGSGRFYTLYTHGGDNAATPFPYTDDVIADLDSQDWRMIPMRTLKPVVTEPALDTGQNVILTNADVPIVRDGRFLGVAGVDIAISDLSGSSGRRGSAATGTSCCCPPAGCCSRRRTRSGWRSPWG
jgi:hypothetical protein